MKSRYLPLILIAVATLFTACEDRLDIAQHGVLNYETYYNTDEEAETAATAIYLEMRGMDYNYRMGKNLLSDDFWAGGGGRNDNSDLEQLNEYTFSTDQTFLKRMFESYYKLVYKANVVLAHVPDETHVQKQVRAEAKVFRAFAYFDLITMWGNPPLVDHELLPSEYSQPNGETEALWKLVETDLTEAINSGSLVQKSNLNDNTTWRITKQFAQAMLGKAYLWQNKNQEAATVLNEVIGSGLYDLYDGNYEDLHQFNYKFNKETLFESSRVSDPNNPNDSGNNTMFYVMTHWRTDKMQITPNFYNTGWGFCNPQKGLYDAFVAEEGVDGYRLGQTMKTVNQMAELGNTIKPNETMISEGYFMWKFRVIAEEIPVFWLWSCNNPRWMRYAEVLLLAAEANLAAGDTPTALQCLNKVRSRAQLPAKLSITLQDIITEKRLELCGESVRYQDLIRWGLAEDALKEQGKQCPLLDSDGNVTYKVYNTADNYGFKGKHKLLPYPGTEMRLNPNIIQNPGW